MLLHGQLVVQMKAEITDDSGRLYSRQSYSKWAVQVVQAGQICLRPEPDSLSFVGIQLQATWLAPSADIICAAWETHAQRVGVARLTTIMELSVVGVEVWPYGMSIQQWNNVFSVRHKTTWTQDRALRYTAVDWKTAHLSSCVNTNCDLLYQISCTYIIVKYRDITRTLYLTIDSQLVGAVFLDHGVDALNVLCAQLTRDLFALYYS